MNAADTAHDGSSNEGLYSNWAIAHPVDICPSALATGWQDQLLFILKNGDNILEQQKCRRQKHLGGGQMQKKCVHRRRNIPTTTPGCTGCTPAPNVQKWLVNRSGLCLASPQPLGRLHDPFLCSQRLCLRHQAEVIQVALRGAGPHRSGGGTLAT